MGILQNCLVDVLPCAHFVISFPLRGVKVLHCAQYDLTRPSTRFPLKHKIDKKRHPGGLPHAVRAALYGLVANRRQPQQVGEEGRGLQQ